MSEIQVPLRGGIAQSASPCLDRSVLFVEGLRGRGIAEWQVEKVWQAVEAAGRPLEAAAINAGISIGRAFLDNDLEDELT